MTHESTTDNLDESAAEASDEVVDRTDQGLGNNPFANQAVRQLGEPDRPGPRAVGGAAHEHGRFDPGSMTDGSTDSAPDRPGQPAPDGEPLDPTGGSSDGGESGQDAGSSS